jgi:hypothetical protein
MYTELNRKSIYLLKISVCIIGIPLFILLPERPLYQVSAQVTIFPGTEDLPESSFQNIPPPANIQPNFTASSISQNLSYAHFLPLTNSPGNQVKLILNYSTSDLSVLKQPVNALMEVHSANDSLIKISSFASPIVANQSGSIQLATTLTNPDLNNVTAEAEFTDPEKLIEISNPVKVHLKLGQIIQK